MELQWLSYVVEHMMNGRKSNVKLLADIRIPDGVSFQSIGSGKQIFTGTFDGGGHAIENLQVQTASDQGGLFYALKDSTIQNLRRTDVKIRTQTGFVGAVARYAISNNIFENIVVDGLIGASGTSYGLGGLVACVGHENDFGNTYFIRCINRARIDGSKSQHVGGLLGAANQSGDNIYFYSCANEGSIVADGATGYVLRYGYLQKDATLEVIGFTQLGTVNGQTGSICSAPGSDYFYLTQYADGTQYQASKDASGNWVAVEIGSPQASVAQISGTYYTSLEAAILDAQPGATIIILQDISLTAPVTINKTLILQGQNQKDGSKPTLCGHEGMISFSGTGNTLTRKNLELSATRTGQWYLLHGAGTLKIDHCDFTVNEAIPYAGTLILGTGTPADPSYQLHFTDNTVTVHTQLALSGVGSGSYLHGSTIQLLGEVYEGERRLGTTVLALSASQSGTVTVTENTFRNANLALSIAGASLSGKNLQYRENKFYNVPYAFAFSPKASKDNSFTLTQLLPFWRHHYCSPYPEP